MLKWLSDNSVAIQAVISALGCVLTAVTIVVLVFYTWRAANRQARAAEAQADAARALMAVSEAQTRAAEVAAGLASIANQLTRTQMLAQMRPILVLVQDPLRRAGIVDKMNYFIRNQGPGAAQHVTWWYGKGRAWPRFEQRISSTLIGSGHDAEIALDWNQLSSAWVTVSYDSLDGQRFLTSASVENGGLIQVQIDPSN
jgi:hypothetical protein